VPTTSFKDSFFPEVELEPGETCCLEKHFDKVLANRSKVSMAGCLGLSSWQSPASSASGRSPELRSTALPAVLAGRRLLGLAGGHSAQPAQHGGRRHYRPPS